MTPEKPIELLPIFRERVWGRQSLAPFFPDGVESPNGAAGHRIGEAWFTFEENPTSLGQNLGPLVKDFPEILGTAADSQHPGMCPILLKLLFTSQRLSVQVHPGDVYAQQHHQCLGKTEAWYVVDSQPPGEVAVGFREPLSPERFKDAIASGEIEELLEWRKVKRGDVIFTPAGTVHAIGAGVTICEVQQNSDITYRLYDYGRARELHVEHGAAVSQLGPHEDPPQTAHLAAWRDALVACQYFRIELLRPPSGFAFEHALPYYLILLCIGGTGRLDQQQFRPGQAWLIPAGCGRVSVEGKDSEWILTYASDRPATGLRSR